jgi:alkylhydroperoxidase family enzyme
VTAEDIELLRREGLPDEAIHDAAQVIAYFNYINRVADGLGVDLEDWMPPKNPPGPAG